MKEKTIKILKAIRQTIMRLITVIPLTLMLATSLIYQLICFVFNYISWGGEMVVYSRKNQPIKYMDVLEQIKELVKPK